MSPNGRSPPTLSTGTPRTRAVRDYARYASLRFTVTNRNGENTLDAQGVFRGGLGSRAPAPTPSPANPVPFGCGRRSWLASAPAYASRYGGGGLE